VSVSLLQTISLALLNQKSGVSPDSMIETSAFATGRPQGDELSTAFTELLAKFDEEQSPSTEPSSLIDTCEQTTDNTL